MKGRHAEDPRTEPGNSHPPGLATTTRMAARRSRCLQRTPAAPFDYSYHEYTSLRRPGCPTLQRRPRPVRITRRRAATSAQRWIRADSATPREYDSREVELKGRVKVIARSGCCAARRHDRRSRRGRERHHRLGSPAACIPTRSTDGPRCERADDARVSADVIVADERTEDDKRPRSARRRPVGVGTLDEDDAFIALLIAAMEASGHVSAEEAERAHHIIWSMHRFRHRSGEAVGRRIERIRTLIEKRGASSVIEAAAREIPTRLRRAAFAVAADLVLVDGRMERLEGRFLRGLSADLGLDRQTAKSILDVMRVKNSA
ncbi:MAG: hypothetical protein GEU82_17690 [Luteitalea sp.]|nr:hypothetical protein [Luteitalea sp.]